MSKTLTLPSGKVATLKKGRGYDLLQAQQKAKTSEEIPYALIAELAEIDGQKLVYEDILELDLEDVIALNCIDVLPDSQSIIHLCKTTGWQYSEIAEMTIQQLTYWCNQAIKYTNNLSSCESIEPPFSTS